MPDQPKASRFAFLARLRERAPQRPRRAAVVGAGVMGGRIAWLFTRNGIPVAMKDVSWDAVLKGYQTAYRVYEELAGRGRVDGREIGLSMHRLSGMVDYEGLGNPDLVIEAVVENLGVKKEVLAELESRVRADAILASNTSSLSITEMAAGLREPGRLVGMHFFNPPNLMPLVEIVPGRLTTERTVLGARVAALALGKTPIVVRDSPGFLVNRLLMSYLNECLLLPLEGLDYREVDAMAVRFGMPMGPFALLDEIGLDVAREVARSLHEAYGGRMGRDGLFDALKGRPDLLGRKSGKGFYLYRGVGKRTANPEMRGIVASLRDGARGRDAMSAFDALHRSLMAMVNEAARALEEGVVDSAERLDLALVLGIGFPPFRGGLLRYADELGAGNVLESLLRYERRFGERFAPAPLIEKLAKGKSGFYAAR